MNSESRFRSWDLPVMSRTRYRCANSLYICLVGKFLLCICFRYRLPSISGHTDRISVSRSHLCNSKGLYWSTFIRIPKYIWPSWSLYPKAVKVYLKSGKLIGLTDILRNPYPQESLFSNPSVSNFAICWLFISVDGLFIVVNVLLYLMALIPYLSLLILTSIFWTLIVPSVGIEPTATRLKGARSAYWAKTAL